MDGVPIEKLTELGIKVAGGGNTNSESTADFGMSLLLASARNIVSGPLWDLQIYHVHIIKDSRQDKVKVNHTSW